MTPPRRPAASNTVDLIGPSVQVLFNAVLVASVYLLFAGHNHPGGGFVGGLVAGAAIAMRYITGGIDPRWIDLVRSAHVEAARHLLLVAQGAEVGDAALDLLQGGRARLRAQAVGEGALVERGDDAVVFALERPLEGCRRRSRTDVRLDIAGQPGVGPARPGDKGVGDGLTGLGQHRKSLRPALEGGRSVDAIVLQSRFRQRSHVVDRNAKGERRVFLRYHCETRDGVSSGGNEQTKAERSHSHVSDGPCA